MQRLSYYSLLLLLSPLTIHGMLPVHEPLTDREKRAQAEHFLANMDSLIKKAENMLNSMEKDLPNLNDDNKEYLFYQKRDTVIHYFSDLCDVKSQVKPLIKSLYEDE